MLAVATGSGEVGGDVGVVPLGAGARRYGNRVVDAGLNIHVRNVERDPAGDAAVVPDVGSAEHAFIVIAPDPCGVIAGLAGQGIDAEVGDRAGDGGLKDGAQLVVGAIEIDVPAGLGVRKDRLAAGGASRALDCKLKRALICVIAGNAQSGRAETWSRRAEAHREWAAAAWRNGRRGRGRHGPVARVRAGDADRRSASKIERRLAP